MSRFEPREGENYEYEYVIYYFCRDTLEKRTFLERRGVLPRLSSPPLPPPLCLSLIPRYLVKRLRIIRLALKR